MTAIHRTTGPFPPFLSTPAASTVLTHPVTTVPHAALRPGGVTCRNDYTEDLTGLAVSIYQNTEYGPDGSVSMSGIQTPLIARPGAAGQPGDIAVGDRRWHAVALLIQGLDYEIDGKSCRFQVPADYPVPVQLREMSDADMIRVAATDSAHHAPLTELDQADLSVALHRAGFSYDQIARQIGVSFATVERRILLGNHLGREGRELLRSGLITMKGARLLCSATGELRQTLIRGARSGLSTKELELLLGRSSVQVKHALFDVKSSGLAVHSPLFAEQGPDVFADTSAALARQLEAVHEKARAHERSTGQWTEIRAVQGDPTILPDGYVAATGGVSAGVLYTYTTSTGRVFEHVNVARTSMLAAPVPVRESPLPRAPGQAPNRLSGVKPWIIQQANELKTVALVDALLAHPKAGLVNAVLQMAQLGGNIKVSGMTSAQKRASERVRNFAAAAAHRHPEVFANHSPGLLQLRRETSDAEAFRIMLTWPEQDLIELLTFFSCVSAYQQGGEYQRVVGEVTGANDLMAERYEFTEDVLADVTRNGLESLIFSMPDEIQPVVIPGESGKKALRSLMISRLPALKAARWLPPYARL